MPILGISTNIILVCVVVVFLVKKTPPGVVGERGYTLQTNIAVRGRGIVH